MDGCTAAEWELQSSALFLYQGITLCQKVVNFTNNPANGCKNTLPPDYCTSMNTPTDYGNSMEAVVRRTP